MRSINNKMLVSFQHLPKEERWQACLDALQRDYTLSFKAMCRVLKCSREWARRYLKPHLHYIYLSNGAGQKANFIKAANMFLNEHKTESTWFSKLEFEELIKSHIVEVTRQTIRIPLELIIREDMLEHFSSEFIPSADIVKKMLEGAPASEIEKMVAKREAVINECATQKGLYLYNNQANMYKRTSSKAVKCSLEDFRFSISELEAVHDLKQYGDSDEEIYRRLFNQGVYKLVLRIPDENNICSDRVYYYEADDGLNLRDSIETILVNYSDYVNL